MNGSRMNGNLSTNRDELETAGSPKSQKAHGDGGPIVLRSWESQLQGEGVQGRSE
jgi:hypothetical protein